MISLKNASFSADGRYILSDVSLEIQKGEFVAVIGANGAGKSTLSKLMCGLIKPTQGQATIAGLDTRETKLSQRARYVGYLFQNPDRQLCRNTIQAELAFGLKQQRIDEQTIRARINELIAQFEFDPDANPMTCGRGQRQRIALAGLIAVRPQVLILDEPTTGLDYRECIQIMDIVRDLNATSGTTVVMISHDMELVQDFARRVLVVSAAHIVADGTVSAIMRDEKLLESASLMPAQIVELCARLGDEFSGITTYMELADKIEEMAKR